MIKDVKNGVVLFYKKAKDDDIRGLAAQMAYFFLLSIFPLMIFMVALLPYLPFTEEQIFSGIATVAPKDVSDFVSSSLHRIISNPRNSLISIGFLAALWSASNGINSVLIALNRAYNVYEERSFIKQRALSILLTFGIMIVLLVWLVLPVFGKQIGQLIVRFIEYDQSFLFFWNIIRWGLSELVLLIAFVLIYWLGPNIKIHISQTIPGAIFASIGWLAASLGFSFYVDHVKDFSATYGSIGVTIILILWFYFTGIFIILGGELNAALSGNHQRIKLPRKIKNK